jgi:YegS/Rv2252/BmrU family lipid kinase
VPPGQAVRALLVVNPNAGLGLWPGAQPAAERLGAAGWLVDVIQTEYEGHGTELARQAVAKGYHVAIGCGGDGTLNELIQGLVGSTTALGLIPMGTANVLAREVGVPLDPVKAAEVLLTGHVRPVDVGRAGERAFLMMAGIGLDADVVREVQHAPRRPPRWLKAPLLALGTARRVFTYPGTTMHLTLDGTVEHGRVLMVVVGNIRSYAGVFQITDEADWCDGLLDVVVFYSGGLLVKLGNLGSVVLRRHKHRQGVAYHRVRRVRIWTTHPCPVQVDGDMVGETPMTFTVEPRALRVLMPG